MPDLLKDWIIPLITIGTVVITATATVMKNSAAIDKIELLFEERFANLKKGFSNIEEKVDKIMENHLPHIQNKVDDVDRKLDRHLTEHKIKEKYKKS